MVIARHDLANFLSPAGVPSTSVTKTMRTPSPPNTKLPGPAISVSKQTDQPKLTFDVVRIDPEGASVFAGRAPPNSDVTILANGREVAAAKADETGAWAAVTERKFAPGEYEFSLRAKSIALGDVTEGQRVRMAVAPTTRGVATPPTRHAASLQAIPAPITFVYNETTFTDEGRKAAAFLAKYLISQRPEAVSLSGHADERGSDRYNMELSRQRLEVVAGVLRDHGFVGKLELIPKGKSEPFTGVERRAFSKEYAFQLDRRVELRLAR